MRAEKLYEAITELDDRFLREGEPSPARRRRPWVGLAAALVLLAVAGPVLRGYFLMGSGNSSAPSGEPCTPAASAPPSIAADSSAPSSGAAAGRPAEDDVPTYGGGLQVELENGGEIEIELLDGAVCLTNPTGEDWTGTVRIGEHEFEQTVAAGETVVLDLEDLP